VSFPANENDARGKRGRREDSYRLGVSSSLRTKITSSWLCRLRNPFALAIVPLIPLVSGCSDASEERSGTGGTGGAAPYPAPVPDDCIQQVTPGAQTLACDGLTFELSVPEACLSAPCGLIVDTHGYGMIANLQDLHTKLRELGNAAGYIVVNPSAPGEVLATSWKTENDAQVYAFMQRVIAAWHVDPKRIHFTGYSQGGWMTWRFACKHADLIASVAPLSAGTTTPGGESCTFAGDQLPARKLPILFAHGTTDGLVDFSTAVAQRDTVLAAWQLDAPETVASGPDYEWTRRTGADGAIFEFIQHDWETAFNLGATPLKGHCFPGSGEFLGCGADTAFNWGQTVLKFFQDHPMP
jgi:poly(3-hydroxybutyrate) depolymerase